jgi:hypothetical protein
MTASTLVQSIIIVLVTGLFSGLLIPYILKKIESNREILKARSLLLDELTNTLWNWRYLSKKVVYYAASGDERYPDVANDYEDKIWDMLNDFRIQTSKARRLLSEKAYIEFEAFYKYITHDIDVQVSSLIAQKDGKNHTKKATELSERFSEEVSKRIDDMLKKVAGEFGL